MKNILIRGPEYEHERAPRRRFSHGNPIAVHSDLFNGPWPENNVRPDRVPLNATKGTPMANRGSNTSSNHHPLVNPLDPFESNLTRG